MKSTWKFKVWTLKDGWPWWLICGGSTVLFLWALIYNGFHIPFPAWLIFGATIAAFYAGAILHYEMRRSFERSIRGYTDQGAMVIFGDVGVLSAVNYYCGGVDDFFKAISDELEDAAAFFELVIPDVDFRRAFEGMAITILSKPFTPQSSTNPYVGTIGRVDGLYYLNTISISWIGDLKQLHNILRHEAGHRLLEVAGKGGLSGTEQHDLLSHLGYYK